MELASDAVRLIDQDWPTVSIDRLTSISGIGPAKASTLLAAFEFARRRIRPEGEAIRGATDVLPLVRHLADRKQETFIAVSLNGAHEVIASRIITIGLLNSTQVHPREVFSDAIRDRACAIIVAHNHPSGNVTPSEEDKAVTLQLKKAGELLGIRLLDHIIFSPQRYHSFQESSTPPF
jgi:DNA repair protein RadC